nr:AraC family transcriptional regulator [Virgibacillus indicus]
MSVQSLREEIVQSNTEKIEQVMDFSDSRMQELENIATRISLDHRLTPYMISHPYYSKEAIEELKSYKVNSSFIDGLYLYYHEGDQVYSPRGSSSMNTLVNLVYEIKEDEIAKFKTDMETVTEATVHPVSLISDNNEQNHIISYLYPIPTNNTFAIGTLAFLVKESTLKKLTQNVLGEFKGNMYIFNEDNELLASSSTGEKLGAEKVQKLAKGETGVLDKTINKENYSLVTVRSEISDWTFVTAMPTAQFYGKMDSLKLTIIIILSIIALIGILTTVFMSFRQYKPIQSLAQSLLTKSKENLHRKEHKDELKSIQEAIELMHEDSEQLHKKMKVHQPLIKDQLLSLLLKGDIKRKTEINDLLVDLEISFNGDSFFIVLVSFKDRIMEHESLQSREKVLELLTTISYEDCVGYGVELIHDNAVAIIVNINENDKDVNEIQLDFVKELRKKLKEYCKEMPTVGIGKIYEGLDWINRSFIEASASIEYNLLNNNESAIYFENITTAEGNPFWYPAEDQAKFIQSLKQGDKIVARETLKNIITNVKEQDASLYMLRCMCFDIINTVLKNTLELGISFSVEQIQSLTEFKTLENLEEILNKLIVDICDEVEERKESHNNLLRDNILNYIHKNYKSHELSLEFTAESFQLSASYLSRFVKEQTGKTFTQFVWQLRNEEFKRQLKETDKPIKKIVLDIGYVDVANFTRKFKKEEGVTPGQYRNHH